MKILSPQRSIIAKRRGFTILEILIVIGIIGILSAVILPALKSSRESQVLKATVEDVASAINRAKSQSFSSINSLEYGVHFETNKAVIFQGTSYSSVASTNTDVTFTPPATISSITLTGGATELYFDRLTGAPNKTGTITIATTNLSKIITISATGTVSSN